MKEIIVVSMLVLALTLATSKALDIQANVTVVARSCGILPAGGSPIQFGNIIQGFESAHSIVQFINPGNIPTTDANVKGSNWIGTTNGNEMNVSLTSFNECGPSQCFKPVWQLDTQPRTIWGGIISPGGSGGATFWLTIPIDQQPDTYTQNITFTVTC
jgi:hypothetical protein